MYLYFYLLFIVILKIKFIKMYSLLLLKKNKRTFKKKYNLLIAIVKNTNKNSFKVVECLGSYDFHLKKLTFNVFRFIFWLAKNVRCSGRVTFLLCKFNIINLKFK